ncbi:MAG: hypothetical protein Q6365_010885 [Candidatus Sigynarchaeota archaeon]
MPGYPVQEGSDEEPCRRGSSRKNRVTASARHDAITAFVDMLNRGREHGTLRDASNTRQVAQPGFLSLRQELLEELNRLNRAMHGEVGSSQESTVHDAPPRSERIGSQDQDEAEHDDANQPHEFRSLRQEMIGELRRLKRMLGIAPEEDPVAKLSPGDRAAYDKFMTFFARCPVCGKQNHDMYLQDFYFTPGPDKIALRDSMVRLIEKTTDFDNLYANIKLTIGIPCCNCFKSVFSKSIIRVFSSTFYPATISDRIPRPTRRACRIP